MKVALPCVAQFVIVLDVTIVAIALPAIQADLGFSTAALGLGDHGLHAGLRRLPAGRRAAGRPDRAPAHVRARPGACSPPRRWPADSRRARRSCSPRAPPRASARRSSRRPRSRSSRRARPEGPCPRPRARLVDGGRGRRRRLRVGARRNPERAVRLALGVPRQRPAVRGRRAARPARARRVARPARARASTPPARCWRRRASRRSCWRFTLSERHGPLATPPLAAFAVAVLLLTAFARVEARRRGAAAGPRRAASARACSAPTPSPPS